MRSTLVVVAALIAAPSIAAADDIAMPWDAPVVGCPTAAEFLDYVADELDEPRGADELGLWVRVGLRTVGPDSQWLWYAQIRDDQGNQRTMTAPSCDELAHAVALVVAMAQHGLTPAVAPALAAPVEPDEPAALAPPSATAETAAGSPIRSRTGDTLGLSLRGTGVVDLGVFNGAAPGWGVGAELAVRRWAVDLALTRLGVWMSDQPGLHNVATAVTARGCALRTRSSWRVALCTGLEVARLDADGYLGGMSSRTEVAVDYRFGAVLSWRMTGAIRLRLDSDAAVMAVRPLFIVEDTFGPSGAPSTLSFRTGLSLEIGIR